MIEFFMPMIIPTVTAQMKRVTVTKKGKPRFYDGPDVANTRQKLRSALAAHKPETPLSGPIRLIVKWLFLKSGTPGIYVRIEPLENPPQGPQWKTTKPDLDNLIKALKDAMTEIGFWGDDAQVASEINEKFC